MKQSCHDLDGSTSRNLEGDIDYVSIDSSAEFRKTIYDSLPEPRVSVDYFHTAQSAHQMITVMRQRRVHDLHGRRGRKTDRADKYRKPLTCNVDSLSHKQAGHLKEILESDTELVIVCAIQEHVRDLLKTNTSESFQVGWDELQISVKASGMDEAKSLPRTFTAWKKELETYCLTRLTNVSS